MGTPLPPPLLKIYFESSTLVKGRTVGLVFYAAFFGCNATLPPKECLQERLLVD